MKYSPRQRRSYWQLFAFAATLVLTLTACIPSPPKPGATSDRDGTTPPDVQVRANAAVHSIYPMLESIIIEYDQDIALPEQGPENLYSFTDNDADGAQSKREVTAVYTNDTAAVREDQSSVPGRFVVIQLDQVANPDPHAPGAWMPDSTAGRAVTREGPWVMTFRTDYTDVQITQSFDAQTSDGDIVRPAGVLPELSWENVAWPDFASFTTDEVYASQAGDIRFSFSLPLDYDPTRSYPMMVSVPGYGGQLLSEGEETRGVNVFTDRNALAWAQTSEDMIVLAPQPAASGEDTSAQIIDLVEHFLDQYAVDPTRVYGLGYSGGAETMAQVLSSRADLFAAYVHASAQWAGGYEQVVAERLPVYIFMARSDEYYGPERAQEAHDELVRRYIADGLDPSQIDQLVKLDLPDDAYFARQGIDYFHDGGQVVSDNADIVTWVLAQRTI